MIRLLLVAATVAFANGASLSIAEPHIFGGHPTDIAKVPYLASVRLRDEHRCGGVILSPTKILTLARYLFPDLTADYSVRVGSTTIDKGGQLSSAIKITHHPKYKFGQYEFDVGIITLKTPLQVGGHTNALPAVLAPKEPAAGENVTISGFSTIDAGPFKPAILRAVQIPVVAKKDCDRDLVQFITTRITENLFCAGAPGKNLGMHDYGGPAVNSKKELVGIGLTTSYIEAWKYPGVYISVNGPEIRKFIKENL